MRKIMTALLLSLTVYLNSGEVHKYEGAYTVHESKPYEDKYQSVEYVEKEKPFSHFPESGKVIIDESEITGPYVTILNSKGQPAGMYPKESVKKIENT